VLDTATDLASVLFVRHLPVLSFHIYPKMTKQETKMETLRGKETSFVNASLLAEMLMAYETIQIDLGTGDGRFVQSMATNSPKSFVIGVDACRENLVDISRRAPENALFVIANAASLPHELGGLAQQVTINFPWGTLLEGLLSNEPALFDSLAMLLRPKAKLEIRLNSSALGQAGYQLEEGTERVWEILRDNDFSVKQPSLMKSSELAAFPTTWAKRLAYGRDPRAYYLQAVKR
jgi:16S rRNA (adenine(1408)-N(1))-methyltransferase